MGRRDCAYSATEVYVHSAAGLAIKAHGFRYVDVQIWTTAKRNQVPVVLSEDFPVGATVEGVTFEHPLAEDYDRTDL